jgi:hypothetical protein
LTTIKLKSQTVWHRSEHTKAGKGGGLAFMTRGTHKGQAHGLQGMKQDQGYDDKESLM